MPRIAVEILNSSGVKTAQLQSTECECMTRRLVNGEWTIELDYTVPRSEQGEDKSAYLTTGSKIRLTDYEDSSTRTFIITKPSFIRDERGVQKIMVSGEHQSMIELARNIVTAQLSVRHVLPSLVLAKLLSYVSGYSVGTVNPTDKIDIESIGWEPVSSGLQKLIGAIGAIDLSITEAGAVSLLTSMGSDNGVRIYVGRNMQSIKNTRYIRRIVNKMYGVGGGQPSPTIAGAPHVVASITSATITTQGNKVVAESDSWNTYKVRFITGAQAGNSFVINDCTHGASADTLVLASTPSPAVVAGDKFVITDSSDVDVSFILAATSLATYGQWAGVYRNENYVDATNLVVEPSLDGSYTSGVCAGWTKIGAGAFENLNAAYIQNGSKSQGVSSASAGHGMEQVIGITAGQYYNITGWVYIASGTVQMQVLDGSAGWSVEKTAGTNSWQRFRIMNRFANNTLTVRFVQSGATAAVFYIDTVSVTKGILDRPFTANSNLKSLWDRAFDEIMKYKDPQIEYEVSFVDLYKMDPKAYPYDKISLGDTIYIYDSSLGINGVSARVKEIKVDEFRPENTKHVVSNV